jgi:hypothetical protein
MVARSLTNRNAVHPPTALVGLHSIQGQQTVPFSQTASIRN